MARYYVLAKGTKPLPSAADFPWPYEVALCFDEVASPVALSEGVGHGAAGGLFTAAEALKESWVKHIQFANGEWLVPVIEKLAQGAEIDSAAVIQSYITAHGHEPESFVVPNANT